MTNTDPDIRRNAEEIIFGMWDTLTEDERKEISEHLTIEEFQKNEYIYKELEIPKCIKWLISGKVKICKSGVTGRDQILRTIVPSEIFSFRAYFANDDYLTSALSFGHSVVASVPMTIIDKLLHTNIQVCRKLIKQLAIELGKADSRTVSLTQKHIRGRLAESLITLKNSYGLEEDGYTLSIYLSREELANMSNMTTSNAIRTLSAFATDKIIAIDGRKIKLINEEELKRISENG